MRILYVTNDLPWPLTSGYLRHYHFIRALSARHDVTLLSLVRPGHSPEDVAALEPFVERLVTRPSRIGRRRVAQRIAARLGAIRSGGDPAAVALGEDGARLHREAPFDAILLSGKRTYPVLRALPDLPLVADLCDATSSRIRGQLAHARLARRLPLAVEYVEMRRVERALVRRARHVVFASVRDREAIVGAATAAGRAPATVVPNGVDLGTWVRSAPRLGDAIVLTGAMDYPPNADAAIELVAAVLPLVREQVADASALIVGRDPTEAVLGLGEVPGVTVTGYVDDVRPYLERAAVFAAPIRFGAGIQNKVLEAMAMEVPVVATPLAADGLRTDSGRTPPIDVATRPADLADAIVRRLRAAADGAAPDAGLRAYVADGFDWGRQADRLEALLCDAIAPAPAATTDPSIAT